MYTVKLDGHVLVHSDWPPVAQAAWSRATRDREAAQHGGVAELWLDNELLARVQPEIKAGHPWPDRQEREPTLHDVTKGIVRLARNIGINAKQIAEEMTESGLPTTRSRVDALRGSTGKKCAEVTNAELVVMLDALTNATRPSE